ncbi:hypothetical protein [Vibrio maerlii]|uniref:hypothetical protein n=1 Tax=Vibrio maerlii TaxID=2231648 RepID=UPI000E3C9731|nr:hypothetical protein [Vibrio maerlii]
MYKVMILTLIMSTNCLAADISALYETEQEFTYDDLVVDVKGYKVPTLAAFKGWMLMNHAEDKVRKIGNHFKERGVTNQNTMPLHLVLLQGTNWVLNDTSVFTLPNAKHIDNMANTLLFVQKYIEPEIGVVVPVSGERNKFYNDTSGGAPSSKHLEFCALDMVPLEDINRPDLHKKLDKIWSTHGKEHNVGLGLYSGVRFHIDTCGFRRW